MNQKLSFIRASLIAPLPLEEITNALFRTFPGSAVQEEDRFVARLSAVKSLITEALSEGRSIEGFQHVLGSVEEAARKNGPTKMIALRVGQLVVLGSVCSTGLLFATKNPEDKGAIDRIAACVRSRLNCAELETG